MERAWVRDIRDQCKAAGVAFFFKQWGGAAPEVRRPQTGRAGVEPISEAWRAPTLSRRNKPPMVSLADYAGREQSYVKHVFLERYLEALIFKTASVYNHIVYVDGFAGPWQSASEQFEDTSFGIALNALAPREGYAGGRRARIVRMTAFLVEQRRSGLRASSQRFQQRFRDIAVKTYSR